MDEDVGFDALYRSTGPRLWRAILAYTGGRRELAEDVVAEAFTRALERSGSIRSVEPYLYRVAFRLAAQELRRTPTVADVPDRPIDDPELSVLFDALRELSPGQRAAVYLHYEADLPAGEVARLMGTSAPVVRVHLMRGRRRLERLLEDDDA